MIFYRNSRDPSKVEKYAVMAQQNGARIAGKGSDKYGNFNIVGRITPPATIELNKVYPGITNPKKPIILSGSFKLPSNPIYAHGRWSYSFTVGKYWRKKEMVDVAIGHCKSIQTQPTERPN